MSTLPIAQPLDRATPESTGFSSQAILDFLEAAQAQGPGQELHSLVLVHQGKVIAEGAWAPFSLDRKHLLYSLSKSFTASAVGRAIGEQLLTLDDHVISFFPDETPAEPSAHLAAMKVRHLLSMSTGHEAEPLQDLGRGHFDNWVEAFLNYPVPFEPGTVFLYNSMATFMLSAIVEKLTRQSLLEYIRPRLLDPLGITEATWDLNPQGITVGGWGMSLRTESIAKFGQLYLQNGQWNGKRILPDGWVQDATRSHIDNSPKGQGDWAAGYGFQFWRCQTNCYRGDGAFGQYCIISPENDLVVALTGRCDFMQETLDLVWKHLLPAAQKQVLPAQHEMHLALQSRLKNLEIAAPKGSPVSQTEAQVTGKVFDTVDQTLTRFKWNFDQDGCDFSFHADGNQHQLKAGRSGWTENAFEFENGRPQPVAARGAWTSPETYSISLRYLEEPYSVTYKAEFRGQSVTVTKLSQGRLPTDPLQTFTAHAR